MNGLRYQNFGNHNAIKELSSLITKLYEIEVPKNGRTTYNVGTINGGTSVNTIPQYAEMLYEIRSDEEDNLRYMKTNFYEVIEKFKEKGTDIRVETVGERPCMGKVDDIYQTQLTNRAIAATRKHFLIEPNVESGSTDCNIPLSMGIPSITAGCFLGNGAHTREEYVQLDSLRSGFYVALEMILPYFDETN